jgi:hypothetical protein
LSIWVGTQGAPRKPGKIQKITKNKMILKTIHNSHNPNNIARPIIIKDKKDFFK